MAGPDLDLSPPCGGPVGNRALDEASVRHCRTIPRPVLGLAGTIVAMGAL